MPDWETLTLEIAGVKLLDCDHKTPTARETGRPYVGIPQMTTGRVVFETARKISEEDYVHWTRKTKHRTNDVILSRRTNPGVTAVDDTGADFALGQNLVLLRADGSRVLPEFLRWMVHTPEWWEQIDKYLNVGAVFSSLKCKDVPKFELKIPPSTEQVKINSVLRPISDKIELNRRMNETLEEMARALYRDWFVDFGPTRRQMEGATDSAAIMGNAFPPEKAATLAPLFPAKLGEDGLPEGWVDRPFEAFVEIVGGGTPKTKVAEYWGGVIPWFSVVDAPIAGAVYVHSTEKCITEAGLENSSARIVREGTTIISARGTVGKICIAPCNMTFNQSCYALRPKTPVGEFFVYLATGQLVERLQAMAHGSVFSTITRNTFSSLSFAGANEDCFTAFEEMTAPLFAKIKANGQENQTLAEMRDLLLPKLMSGEIRLKDAEIENVANSKQSNVIFATDMFGAKILTPEQEAEREVVMVAVNVSALQSDGLLVGNVRLMKANYLIHRRMGWSTSEFERRAAGPHCKRLNDEVREAARQRSWIRQTTETNAKGKNIPGNRPASKYSEVKPLIAQYGLNDALTWLREHFNGASREWMECVATVDEAILSLTRQSVAITVENIKADIAFTPEWKPKLSKPNFSDAEISRAIRKIQEIF